MHCHENYDAKIRNLLYMKHASIFMRKMNLVSYIKKGRCIFFDATYFTYQESSMFGCKHPLCSTNVKDIIESLEQMLSRHKHFLRNINFLFYKCSLKLKKAECVLNTFTCLPGPSNWNCLVIWLWFSCKYVLNEHWTYAYNGLSKQKILIYKIMI